MRLARIGHRPVLATGAVLVIVLTPIVIWGLVVRTTVVDDIARREAEQRLNTAQLASAAVHLEVEDARGRLRLFVTRQALRDAIARRDRTALERHLEDLVGSAPAYASALILDPDGRLITRRPASPGLYDQSFADRDYYRGAVTSDGPYVSEVFASRADSSLILVATALAVREGERILGVVQVTLPAERLLELLRPLRSVKGRTIHLIDRAGRVVASTDPGTPALSTLRLPGFDGAIAGDTRTTTAGSNGTFVVLTYAPVRSAGWILYVADDPSVILAAQQRLEGQIVLGAAFTAALALAAAIGIALLFATTLRQRAALTEREAALARTNGELQAASRHKSEFLASMSHELRTPLNAILGFSDLLGEQLDSALTDRHRRYLRNIRDAGEHLLGLINDVLDLSKVEAGRVELRPELVALEPLVAPVIASTRASAESRGITFAYEVPGDRVVAMDVGRARQILFNLLSNAVKFTTSAGEVRLRMEFDQRTLRITVSDTGIGIPAEKRERLFGTFERLHEGRSDAPGTGLGLALTKRLVEVHGGAIYVTSEEGRGTTFVVDLPGVLVETGTAPRVLVVEDDRRDADLVVALAGQAGLATEVVRSISEAKAAIRRAPPIGVVLDIRLPDGRGERVLEILKQDPVTRTIPTIVVSVEDEEHRSRVLGADDHLTKPIDHARLDAWLRRVAARSEEKEVSVAGAPRR